MDKGTRSYSISHVDRDRTPELSEIALLSGFVSVSLHVFSLDNNERKMLLGGFLLNESWVGDVIVLGPCVSAAAFVGRDQFLPDVNESLMPT